MREFLERDVMPAVEGRVAFHTRVAVNALGMLEREADLGPALDAEEHERLADLLGHDGSVRELHPRARGGDPVGRARRPARRRGRRRCASRSRPSSPSRTPGTFDGMRIATWNVNSLKARLPRVEEWLAYADADVLCLQETKLADKNFPTMAFSALGYDERTARPQPVERRRDPLPRSASTASPPASTPSRSTPTRATRGSSPRTAVA